MAPSTSKAVYLSIAPGHTSSEPVSKTRTFELAVTVKMAVEEVPQKFSAVTLISPEVALSGKRTLKFLVP